MKLQLFQDPFDVRCQTINLLKIRSNFVATWLCEELTPLNNF